MTEPVAALQTPLTTAERRRLLGIARESIRTGLRREPVPDPGPLTPLLAAPGAAFVSLHADGRLRGCIGTLRAEDSLHATVARMARGAAFEDPRFPPVCAPEIDGLAIEISRLSPLVAVPPEAVVPGRHGVAIALAGHQGVFLPQVAPRYGWDRETLLAELCVKAGLPRDAWRRPELRLSVFEAEVFSDAGTEAPAAA